MFITFSRNNNLEAKRLAKKSALRTSAGQAQVDRIKAANQKDDCDCPVCEFRRSVMNAIRDSNQMDAKPTHAAPSKSVH